MSLNLRLLSKKFTKAFVSSKHIYTGSDNYIFLLKTQNSNKYIYRKSRRDKPDTDIKFEKEFSDYLLKQNIPVRRVLYSGSESLLNFCKGTSHSVQQISETMAFNAGQMLAKFHNASKKFNMNSLPKREMTSELARSIKAKTQLQNKYTNGKDFISVVENLLQSKFLKTYDKCIIHNDFRVQNVLFQGKKISAILDFDWSCVGTPLKDLAHALVEWSFPDGGSFNKKIFQSFLHGYSSIRPNIDFNALKYWIAFSCISDTSTYLCDRINDIPSGGKILSWMYGKYLFFDGQDIAKLSE